MCLVLKKYRLIYKPINSLPIYYLISYCLVVLGLGGSYMKKGIVALYDKSAIVRRYIDIYSREGYDIYFVHAFSTLLLGGFKRALGLNQIIAEHLSLQLIYIVIGFLFLLNVNIYILRLYNYIWSLIDRIFRTVFPLLGNYKSLTSRKPLLKCLLFGKI